MSDLSGMRVKRKNEGSVFLRRYLPPISPGTRVRFKRIACSFFFVKEISDISSARLIRNSAGCFALISLCDKCNRTKDVGTGR